MHPADFLPVLLLGQPVFRKVHAREHPIPSTVITITGTRFIMILENQCDEFEVNCLQMFFRSLDINKTQFSPCFL